jgi:hypothetical protein
MTRKGVGLGDATGVRSTGFAKLRIDDIVAGTVGRAPGVLVTHVSEGRMWQVILPT